MSSLSSSLVASLLGILSHLFYFIHGEHHPFAVTYFQVAISTYVALPVIITSNSGHSIFQSIGITTILFSAYLCCLFTSVLIYRALFHRLDNFPGPPLARLGKFYHSSQILRQTNFVKLHEWHTKYGEFVRIGSDGISCAHPDALQAVLGPKSPCKKSALYDLDASSMSLHATRDPVLHDKRRKLWDQGLSVKAIRQYQPRITSLAELLADKLEEFGGAAVNVTPWMTYFGFDAMADVVFNKSFNMLRSGKEHYTIQMLDEAMTEGAAIMPLLWLVMILMKIPLLQNKMSSFVSWCKQQADERRNMDISELDIMTHLVNEDPMSDIYADGFFDMQSLTGSELLNAIIFETLRLNPPVASGLTRITPPEGLNIGGKFIPGEINVTVPFWTIQRSPKAWVRPNDFIPERWFSRPELVLNQNAYAPFSLGRFNCAGKALAMVEMRIAVAILVTRFDIRLAPGEDGMDLHERSHDRFNVAPRDLRLNFKKRARLQAFF